MQVGSILGSAANTISNGQQKATNAAQDIANLSVQDQEIGGTSTVTSTDLFKPVLSMKAAEQQTYAGIKLLKAQNNMLGAIINVTA